MKQFQLIKISVCLLMASMISACGSDSNSKTLSPFEGLAVVQSTGDGSMIEFTNAKDTVESGFLPKTATDYAVFSNGEYFYQLGKYNIDTVQKYHIDNPEQEFYANDGYSLREVGDTVSANPSSMAFLNDDTAVITRYGSTDAWVINLTAQTSDEFVIKKLDLSHHINPVDASSNDQVPEASMAFINNAKLFIVLQNLDNWTPTNNAKVAVFDTNTWLEIDTDLVQEGIQAIPLSLKNPQSGVIHNNNIYLGFLVYAPYGSGEDNTGGIELINTDTFSHTIITDQIAVSAITVDANGKVFFADYAAWQSNSLYVLNNDNTYSLVSEDTQGINISMLASPGDSIWLGTNSLDSQIDGQAKNQIIRIDSTLNFSIPKPLDEIVLTKVETALKPIKAAFLDIQFDKESTAQ